MSIFNNLAQWLPFGKVPEMDAQAVFKRLQKNNIQIVDVRSKMEWDKSHIEGSLNLPITSLSINTIKQLQLSQEITTVVIVSLLIEAFQELESLNSLGLLMCINLKVECSAGGNYRCQYRNNSRKKTLTMTLIFLHG
tara:strand:- start:694 stop:1104 length:411 start_codon:yes stop_codon:yes gene_type:complete